MKQEISLIELLKSGVHFGHQQSRWHPKMKQFIFTERSGVHIIDLEKTRTKLNEALAYAQDLSSRGGIIVFIGTKKQAQSIVKRHAEACGSPYVINRWIGGLLTNFTIIKKMIDRLLDLTKKQASGDLDKYTKKEQSEFNKEIIRLQTLVGGISELRKIPDAVFVVDLKIEKTAIREAQRKGIPIIALADTNTDPSKVTYPIPANDDATKSIDLITGLLAQSILAGKKQASADKANKPADRIPVSETESKSKE
ncbi:MAG: 30S ribosomal protein S2 [Patescibacteria group bacterium]|jgi:small subunit ribosomal protein S2